MIQRKTFLYFLTDTSSGRSFYVNNGMVQTTNLPTPLPQNPGGWLENEVKFTRNSKYHGLNRTYTTPLKFVGDGATIIRNQYYTSKGVECPITLIILKWDPDTDIYQMYYKGELDLLKITDDSAQSVTCNLLEGGLVKLIKSNESTVYEIPCDGSIPENFQVSIDGIQFLDTFTYQINDNPGITGAAALSCAYLSNNGDNIGIEHGSQNYEGFGGPIANYVASSTNYIFSTVSPTNLTMKGTLSFRYNPGLGSCHVRFGFWKSSGVNYIFYDQTFSGRQTASINFNFPISMLAGEKLFLIFYYDVPASFDIFQTNFTLEFNSKLPVTNTWAVSARDVFKILINKIGNNQYQTQSTLLDNYLNFAITSGKALRGDASAVIKTTLAELFDSVNSILNASLGTISVVGQNDIIFIESKGYVFDSSTVNFDLGEVSDLKIEAAHDYFFNTLKIGYEPQTYDEKAGQSEYNTTAQFKTPITRIVKELSLISKYRADSFGIESVRINYGGKSTTNNASDNATFIINIDRTAASALQDVAGKTNLQTYALSETDVNFDSFIGTHLLPNTGNSIFTYPGAPISATLNLTMHINDTTHGHKLISIQQNGVIKASIDIAAVDVLTQHLSASLILMTGDQIKVHVLQEGIDSSFDIIDANLTVIFTSATVYPLKRVVYDAASGMPNIATAYNIEDLTPKRMLMKHGNYLKSTLFNLQPGQLQFQTTDKNPLLSTSLGAVTITENASVPISSLDPQLFFPVIFHFKTKIPNHFEEIQSAAANGHLRFTYNGKAFYGFPQDVSVKPALDESQEWKLLASPLNNLADLQNLEVDGLNYIDLMGLSLFVPHLCPVKFVPLNTTLPAQYHFLNMDADWFMKQIAYWTDQNPYYQPWQTNDAIHLQMQTNGLGPVQVQLIDCNGTVLNTVALAQVLTPAVLSPNALFEGVVPLTGLADNTYYLLLTAGVGGTTSIFISEPLLVRADWPETLLFEYSNTKNKQSTVFSTGYNPSMRVHGWIDSFAADSFFTTYEDQPSDLELLNGIAYRKFKLNLGNDQGLPDWVIDKLNRITLLNNVMIDGIGYTRNADSKFESQRTPGQPRAYWSLEIREAENRDGVTLSTTGSIDQGLVVISNINTKGFGDGAGANNIVQVNTID